jgi:uncharacterized protein
MESEFEWDLNKEVANVAKHSVDFNTASEIWNGPVFEQADARRQYGEVRLIA